LYPNLFLDSKSIKRFIGNLVNSIMQSDMAIFIITVPQFLSEKMATSTISTGKIN